MQALWAGVFNIREDDMKKKFTTATKRENAYKWTYLGRPRGCFKCGGHLKYTQDGECTLVCQRWWCRTRHTFDRCLLCGEALSISLSDDGADRQCEGCSMVETRDGLYLMIDQVCPRPRDAQQGAPEQSTAGPENVTHT